MTGGGQGGGEPAADRWSVADTQWLCAALESFADFQDPAFVRQVRAGMGQLLDDGERPFPVRYFDHPTSQIMAFVEAITASREPALVLRALADTLRFLRDGTAAMATLDELVDRLAPAGRLRGTRLRDVLAALAVIRPPLPAALDALGRALLPGEPSGLRGTETVARMVTRLNDAREPAPVPGEAGGEAGGPAGVAVSGGTNAVPGGTDAVPGETRTAGGDGPQDAAAPLVLRFLAELARAVPADDALVMTSHITLAAFEMGLPSGVRDALGRRRGPLTIPARSRVLQIRLAETAPGKNEYRVDGSLFDRTEAGLRKVHRREGSAAHPLVSLRELGRTCLVEWHDLTAQADDVDRVQVEFLLPWSLLGHPVDRWLTDAHGYLVGHKYPVVVRSLDRMREPSWRSDWKRRWQALRDPGGAGGAAHRVGWLALRAAPAARDHDDVLHLRGREGEVRAWLDAHPGAAGLALDFAYDHHDPRHTRSVQEAVCEGVPFMVWRRDDGDPGELAERLDESARDRFDDLPGRMRRWRRGASRDDAADMHNHLTLMWDDPECVHAESAFAAPTRPPAGTSNV